MKYGPVAENPVEQQLLTSPLAPRVLFDTFLPLLQARAIMAGVRLGIFESLSDGARTSDELAQTLSLNPETVDLVLRVLVSGDYVIREERRYALTALARGALILGGPAQLTSWVQMMDELFWDLLGRMDEIVRSGRGVDFHQSLRDQSRWAIYQAAMLETARGMGAPLVASLVPVKSGARRLLDIGGSHGLYGALIARAHPPMRSEVLDLPQAVEESRKLAQAEGIDDVVTHRVGNALADDLGRDYDVVLLSNILHHFTPTQSKDLLARVKGALGRDGTVAIWEGRQPEADAPTELVGDAFALFFRLTSTGRCYTASEYVDWLTEAGFSDVQLQPTPSAPFQVLATGRAR
jgi:2-polyprenyl-3-methyl-5-hydroxy-6-metoxy-1,4-benzoquinol methylase